MGKTDRKFDGIIDDDVLSDRGCTPANFMGEVAPEKGIDAEMEQYAEEHQNFELGDDSGITDDPWNMGWG